MKMTPGLRVLRYAFWAFFGLVLLALGVLSTPWFQRAVERRILARFEQSTGGWVEVDRMHFRPLMLQAVFQGVRIHGTEPAGQPPLFSARYVLVGVAPPLFFRRALYIRSLEWDHAEFHIRTNADGSSNVPGPQITGATGQMLEDLLDLAVGRLTISQTTIFWNDQRLPLDFECQDVAILLRRRQGRRYEGNLNLAGSVFRISGQTSPPLTLTSRFELSPGEAKLNSFLWRGPGFQGQASAVYSFGATPSGYLSFQANGEAPALSRLLNFPELRAGNLRVEGQGVYREGQYSARGRIEGREIALQTPKFRAAKIHLSADYAADPQRVEISNLTVSAMGGEARGNGKITLAASRPHTTAQLAFRGLDWGSLLGALPATPAVLPRLRLTSRIDGVAHASWTGWLENMQGDFQMNFRAPSTPPAGSIPMQGRVAGSFPAAPGGEIDLREAQLDTPASSLSAQGSLAAGTPSKIVPRLALQIASTDFTEWQPLVQFLSGRAEPLPLSLKAPAHFTGELTGPLSSPQIDGRLLLGEFELQHWAWDGLEAKVTAGPAFARVSSGHLRRAGSTLNLEGMATLHNWQLAPESAVQLSARADHTPLGGLFAALGRDYPMTAALSGQLTLEGSPSSLQGSGEMELDQATVAGEHFEAITAKVRVANSVWEFNPLRARKGTGQIQGQARWEAARQSLSATLHADNLSLADINHLASASESLGRAGLEGRASFDLQAEGAPEAPKIHATWNVSGVSLAGTPVGDMQMETDAETGQFRFQGQAQGPGGSAHFSGSGKMEGDWPLQIEGEFLNARLDPWGRYFLRSKSNAQVLASGSFQSSGPLKHLDQMELTSEIQKLEIDFPTLEWKNQQAIRLHLAQGVLTAQPFHVQGPSTDLEVEGSVRLANPPVVSVKAKGRADATLLSIVDPALKATGQSELDLQVSGSPSEPLLHGTVAVQDVGLTYGALPFRISGLIGEIRLEGERASLRSLRGVSGGGSVTLGGFVTLSSPPRFEVRTELQQVRLRYPQDFTSVLNGDLRLMGTPDRGQLSGELVVRQMFANENINWITRIAQAGHPFEEQTPGVASPLAANIRLGVRVTSAPPVRLDTQDVHILADIDMRLQGTLASPVQVGSIHALSGDGVFRGNRYKLLRGDINFTNPARTLAHLDLEAQTRVQQYELTLDVSGPFDHLKFAYRSDPPLPATDIISLLALGYSQQQEEMATTAGHPIPTVGASAILSEALSSQMTSRIQRLFGVSRIKIEPNVGLPGLASGAQVTVEQQLSRELTLTYVTNTAASQYRIIQFEWAVSDSVSVLGVRDPNGIFGLEFRFRQRFK